MDAVLGGEWLQHERESWIWMRDVFVPYPFQNNIRYLPKPEMLECLRGLIRAATQIWINDANCPFKLMRTGSLRTVLERVPADSFIPMVMIAILARKAGFRFCEEEVTHLPRNGGQQSLKGILKWCRVGSGCFRQLLLILSALICVYLRLEWVFPHLAAQPRL
jgi:hypothetical protein